MNNGLPSVIAGPPAVDVNITTAYDFLIALIKLGNSSRGECKDTFLAHRTKQQGHVYTEKTYSDL